MPKGLGRRGDTNKAPHKREERRGYTWGGGGCSCTERNTGSSTAGQIRSGQVRTGSGWPCTPTWRGACCRHAERRPRLAGQTSPVDPTVLVYYYTTPWQAPAAAFLLSHLIFPRERGEKREGEIGFRFDKQQRLIRPTTRAPDERDIQREIHTTLSPLRQSIIQTNARLFLSFTHTHFHPASYPLIIKITRPG